jgi:hypothetical protein
MPTKKKAATAKKVAQKLAVSKSVSKPAQKPAPKPAAKPLSEKEIAEQIVTTLRTVGAQSQNEILKLVNQTVALERAERLDAVKCSFQFMEENTYLLGTIIGEKYLNAAFESVKEKKS